MKKILFLLFFITMVVYGQDKTILELPTMTAPATGDYVPVWDASGQATYKLSLSTLNSSGLITSGLNLLSLANTWTNSNSFTSTLEVPTTLLGTTSNGIGKSGGLFAWVNADTVRIGADRNWVLGVIADSGYAVDSNQFVRKDGDNTLSGTNILSNRTALGSGDNSGEVLLPNYTSTNEPTDIHRMFWFNSTNNKMYVNNNGTVKTFLDSSGVVSVVQTGSYLPTSGTLSNASSTLSWASGVITPFKMNFGSRDAGRSLILPLDKNDAVSEEEGSIKYDYSSDAIWVHDGSAYDIFPNQTTISSLISANLGSSAPTSHADALDTLDWENKNYMAGIFGTNENQTVTVINYQAGWVSFGVSSGAGDTVTVTIPSVTIEWLGGVTPTFDDQRKYKVILEYWTSSVAIGSYAWHD